MRLATTELGPEAGSIHRRLQPLATTDELLDANRSRVQAIFDHRTRRNKPLHVWPWDEKQRGGRRPAMLPARGRGREGKGSDGVPDERRKDGE